MAQYAVALQSSDNDATYRVFSALRNSSVGYEVKAAALVEKDENGVVTFPEVAGETPGSGTLGGSLIGTLVGVLGGPLGMLLGWGVGTSIGAFVDADRADDADTAISGLGDLVEPGRNAILAQTEEDDVSVLDAFAEEEGLRLVRRPLEEVEAELDAEREALVEAQKAARKRLREQRRSGRSRGDDSPSGA